MNTPLPGHLATHGLVQRLWPHGDTLDGLQVHAIVDAAQDPSIVAMVRTTGLERTCLFSGVLSPELEAAAPFLVHLSPTAPFTRCLFEQGWHAHWCVLLMAPADVSLKQLRRHLRTLLRVQDEGGRQLMFRFYDPRVLRAWLPTCNALELARVFGPIDRWVCVGDAAAWLEFDRPIPGSGSGGGSQSPCAVAATARDGEAGAAVRAPLEREPACTS